MDNKTFKISDEEIVKTYLETRSLIKTALAAQGNRVTSTIARKLNSLGVDIKDKNIKPILISDEELIELYKSGKSLMEVSRIATGSKGAMIVRQRLKELGIDTSYRSNINKYREKMSRHFHKYSLDEHVFDVIDLEEKAYWLGFLMADGYNHESRSAICLRLQAEDEEILKKFSLFLKSDAPIYSSQRKTYKNHLLREYKEVRVNSVYLSKQLAKLGCVQGKTYTLDFPTSVPEHLVNHFLRGYFDGDGCLCIKERKDRKSSTSKSYQFTLTGRKEFLEVANKYLVQGAGINSTSIKELPNNFAKSIHYGGHHVVKKIMDYLYKDATIYLKRKHDKYLSMVNGNSVE